MARTFALLLVLPSVLALQSCYLSHERTPLLPGLPAARDGGAPMASDGGASIPDTPPRLDVPSEPCVWSSRVPWQLTSPPGDQRHLDVLAVPSGYLVAYGSSNDPPPVPGRFVAYVDLDRSLGTSRLFPEARGHFVGGVGLAGGERGVLAATWDDAGCLTRLLSVEGSPLAPPVGVARASCVAPYATGSSFALFDRPGDSPARVALLDESGARVTGESEVLDVLEDAFWWTRARFEDGTMLVIGMRAGVEPTRAVAQRLDAAGAPLSAPVELPPFDAASRVRAVATEAGALVGWLEAPDGDATSQERALRVFPVDREGNALAAPVTVSTLPAYRDGGLSFARAGADVWATYVESDPGDRFGRFTRIVLLRLSERGALLTRMVLAEGEFFRAPLVRARDSDAVVVYTALVETANQVFVASLACEREER